jgi:predicted kinase
MRKWMRERMKRRKESRERVQGDPAPAPLQPAYFDAGKSESPAPPEKSEEAEANAPTAPDATPSGPSAAGDEEAPKRKRRRRGRGGRGRSGSQSARTSRAKVEATPPSTVAEPVAGPAPVVTTPVAATSTKAPRGVVVLAIGLPGSGKSSWFKRHNITPLSSDLLRALLFDDPREQRFQDLVFSNLRSMLKARLIARRPLNYVDATNLSPNERDSWIKLAKDYGYEVQAVFFDVPVEVCLERNQRRQRQVPEDAMRRMAAKLRAPTFEEGFSKITVVKVKKKDAPVPE